MPHWTLAPLSAAVASSIVRLDGFGPGEESEDVILSMVVFRICPKASITPGTPESAVIVQTSSPSPVALSQEKVKSSPEQVCSLTRRRVTEGKS